jgi:8-oxo-dGTP diphosphatase
MTSDGAAPGDPEAAIPDTLTTLTMAESLAIADGVPVAETLAVAEGQAVKTPAGADGFLTSAIPVSAGALITDRAGRLLILKPTYKSGWTIPGGVMEADGETPWQACQREVREECGLHVRRGALAVMDFRPARPDRPGGIRYLFDCGALDDASLAAVELQAEEISDWRLAEPPDALALLRGPIRRRVRAALAGRGLTYLEDGRPVPEVGRRRP